MNDSDRLNGFLLVDKPQGWTSFDVVAKIRGTIKRDIGHKVKVGHAGTLDPMATGLLILAIGKATKQIEGLVKKSKTYEAEMTLGATSNTDDAEGDIVPTPDELDVDEVAIKSAIEHFQGEIEQVPPQFSAIKVKGQRAYKSARRGEEVVLKSRSAHVEISNVVIDLPKVSFKATVSSGTYIRALARDIGTELGCGGYLSALRRTSIGGYSIDNAISVDGVDISNIRNNILLI